MACRSAALIVAVTALTTAACSARVAGSGTIALPQRPYEIRIDALDPCTVFTPAQLRTLGVDRVRATPAEPGLGPSCYWYHSPDEPLHSYTAERNTEYGIESMVGNSTGITVRSILGFPAIETQSEAIGAPDRYCYIFIDVSSGQFLLVSYQYNGGTLPMNRERACEMALAAAELAMQTVIEQLGE